MIKYKNFGIVGGDMRHIFLSESIAKDENSVKIFANSSTASNQENFTDKLENAIKTSDYVILPLPVTYDGETLNAPFSKSQIKLYDLMRELTDKTVFCGGINSLSPLIPENTNIKLKDYYAREEFQILNALATAEGAINIALSEFLGTIHSSKCLIVGYGRIGKVLSKILKDMGANVTVSARKPSDLAWIEVMGYESINTNNMPQKLNYDLIFNTVPFKIFNRENLLKCSYETKIIDLSSKPGGVDFELAEFLGIKAIHARGLPGKFSPIKAGDIIKRTIYNMIEEERL